MPLKKIFEISDIDELRGYLTDRPDADKLREQLYACFLEHSQYSNASGWNAAVWLCEALAIVGWGAHEPLEAVRGVWFNGNPETYFVDRNGKPHYLDAVWSRRKGGLAIDFGQSFLYGSPDRPSVEPIRLSNPVGEGQDIALAEQRNWIPKNPVRIVRGLDNCYENSRPVVESVEKELVPRLNKAMRPESYGAELNTIILNLSFSFYDNYHCKTNYIIADESWKLTRKDFYSKLLELYSQEEIDDNGYYLRNRFSCGPFRKDTGTVRVEIVLEREFSQHPVEEQKRMLGEYLVEAVERVAKRLERKVDYDFQLMISDFKAVLAAWQG